MGTVGAEEVEKPNGRTNPVRIFAAAMIKNLLVPEVMLVSRKMSRSLAKTAETQVGVLA